MLGLFTLVLSMLGLFTLGLFTLGFFTLGFFTLGLFTLGLFSLGLLTLGLFCGVYFSLLGVSAHMKELSYDARGTSSFQSVKL